jgi:hypothetical protein
MNYLQIGKILRHKNMMYFISSMCTISTPKTTSYLEQFYDHIISNIFEDP